MERPHSFRVEAVVLRHTDYGEADRILSLYTRQLGKTRALCKRRPQGNFTQSGAFGTFYSTSSWSLRGPRPAARHPGRYVEAYLSWAKNLILMGHASYVIELIDRFTYDDETENPAIFRLLTETLAAPRFQNRPVAGHPLLRDAPARLSGIPPQLFECVNCGREILAEDQFYSFSAGVSSVQTADEGCPILHAFRRSAQVPAPFPSSSYAEASRARPAAKSRRRRKA